MKKANILTPVVTAFDKYGNIDIQANMNIYEYLIKGGVNGLVIMGSTGEFFGMRMEQKKQLIDLAVRYAYRIKIIIGTGCMRVDDTVELSNYALKAGAHGVMIVSPYYFKLSAASLESYYNAVASQIKGNIYVYNYPERTSHDLSPELALKIVRKNKNIIGYKDTVTNFEHTRKLIDVMREEFPDFIILSGFDEFLLHNVLSGGDGCIGGLSNLYPELFKNLVDGINERNMEKAFKYQQLIDQTSKLYDVAMPVIPAIKKAMMLRGVNLQDYCIPPLVSGNGEETQKIKEIMSKIDI